MQSIKIDNNKLIDAPKEMIIRKREQGQKYRLNVN